MALHTPTPEDFEREIALDDEAHVRWLRMPSAHRLAYVRWIEDAPHPEDRVARIDAAVGRLRLTPA